MSPVARRMAAGYMVTLALLLTEPSPSAARRPPERTDDRITAFAEGGAQPAGAGPLDLLQVGIDEGSVDPSSPTHDRDIVFSFVLERAPQCDAASDGLIYTVLIDADLDAATGRRLRALPDLGIERQAAARCEGAIGMFRSRSGTVAIVGPEAGMTAHVLRLTVRLSGLPSPEFNWVGMVRQGPRFATAPSSGEPAYWATTERALW